MKLRNTSILCNAIRIVSAAALFLAAAAQADLAGDVQHLQERWAEVNYELEGKARLAAFERLLTDANAMVVANPGAAEVLIWRGIIESTYAGAKGGLGALSLAKASKSDLEQALDINPMALDGSAYTSLGALYYSVPGWPVGFGDDEKAEELLEQALELNPDGIDTNYFYADYLISEERYDEARAHLLKAQAAAPRPGREVADRGRQQEIVAKLEEIAGN